MVQQKIQVYFGTGRRFLKKANLHGHSATRMHNGRRILHTASTVLSAA